MSPHHCTPDLDVCNTPIERDLSDPIKISSTLPPVTVKTEQQWYATDHYAGFIYNQKASLTTACSGHGDDPIPDETAVLEDLLVGGPSCCGLRRCTNFCVKYACILLRSLYYVSFALFVMHRPAARRFMRRHPLAMALFALLSWASTLCVS